MHSRIEKSKTLTKARRARERNNNKLQPFSPQDLSTQILKLKDKWNKVP